MASYCRLFLAGQITYKNSKHVMRAVHVSCTTCAAQVARGLADPQGTWRVGRKHAPYKRSRILSAARGPNEKAPTCTAACRYAKGKHAYYLSIISLAQKTAVVPPNPKPNVVLLPRNRGRCAYLSNPP